MDLHEALKQAGTPKEAEKALREYAGLSRKEAIHVVSALMRMGAESHQPKPAWQGLRHKLHQMINIRALQ